MIMFVEKYTTVKKFKVNGENLFKSPRPKLSMRPKKELKALQASVRHKHQDIRY